MKHVYNVNTATCVSILEATCLLLIIFKRFIAKMCTTGMFKHTNH